MKNQFLEYFKSSIKIKIKGKNIERFIHRLAFHHIDILEMKNKGPHEVRIKIYKKDYATVEQLKTIYEVEQVNSYGFLKTKKTIHHHVILLSCLAVGFVFLFFLSNLIFKIEIVHTNKEIRVLITKELEQHGIHEVSMRKDFKELNLIKTDIMDRHKDKLEWLEIERIGTKYVVRLEMRKLADEKKQYRKQNVIAKKSAVIKKVIAKNGEIRRDLNDYVKEGDVIISGEITLNGEVKDQIKAEGTVYGEVWYTVTVQYPLAYHEQTTTGKTRTAYVIHFLNHRFDLFPFEKFRYHKSEDNVLLKHSFLPFSLVQEQQKEIIKKEEINTEEQAINKAISLARKKLEEGLTGDEKILSSKSLKVTLKESKIEVEVFFTVYEDITSYQAIPEKGPAESE